MARFQVRHCRTNEKSANFVRRLIEIDVMKLSIGQKKELKGMLTFLVVSIIAWLLASLVLHFPWNHTLVLTAISIVISIIQTAFIVFRPSKKDE